MSEARAALAPTLLARAVGLADAALERWLPSPETWPSRLHTAMRYSVFAGGKRLRPALVLASAEACGAQEVHERISAAMAAVELLHTFTLVHDDLPAMDDDDLRRGRPTCHKAFDEATAILAGDALQSLAFEACATISTAAVIEFARAIGSRGVTGGQQEDLDAEGEVIDASPACAERLLRIHHHKTAVLLRASCALGGYATQAQAWQIDALVRYGEALGLAFQIADDILDATASAEVLGKTPGKDASDGKLTWVAVHGLDASRRAARDQADRACEALDKLGPAADPLRAIACYVVDRDR